MRRVVFTISALLICCFLFSAGSVYPEVIHKKQQKHSVINKKQKKKSRSHKKSTPKREIKQEGNDALKVFFSKHSKMRFAEEEESEEYEEGHKVTEKNDNPQKFAEMQRAIRTRYGQDKPEYPLNYRIDELLKAKKITSTRLLNKPASVKKLDWKERGPANIGGRTRTVVVDPSDPFHNTWLAGSAGGGIWKTTNAGRTWTNLTPDLPNLATSTIAIADKYPDIIYAGTGEVSNNGDMVNGSGIWKSTDKGKSWEQLKSTAYSPDFRNVSRIIVDPDNPMLVLASTTPGFWITSASSCILRSTDGGMSWTKVYSNQGQDIEQIIANPKNFNTQYASVNSVGVIRSFDGGLSWQKTGSGLIGKRMEMDISPVDTSRIFISAQRNDDYGFGTGALLFTSKNNGANWQSIPILNYGDLDFLVQGWYDNTIAADIYNVNKIYVGGVNLWEFDLRDSTYNSIKNVGLINTNSFLTFKDYGLSFAGGGIGVGDELHHKAERLNDSDFVNVEIRFGPGKSQYAFRFLEGIDWQMQYQNYTIVPFEVWDTDHNRQLMVSFKDFDKDGSWNLNSTFAQEFIFINSVPYSLSPDSHIATNGGMLYKNIYVICPASPSGVIFDPKTLPNAVIKISYVKSFTPVSNAVPLSDSYNWYGGRNHDVHVDHHCIRLTKPSVELGPLRIIDANDGGIWYSDDGARSFTHTLNGYNTTQFYGADKKNGANEFTGGMQDNGSAFSPKGSEASDATNWLPTTGGDGFEVVWKYDDPDKMISTIYNNMIFRSTDGGSTWFEADNSAGLSEVSPSNSPFLTRVAKSNQDPDLLFAVSKSGVWRSEDFANSWHLTQLPDNWGGESYFSNVKISLVNPQVVWAGEAMVKGRPLFVSTDGGRSFDPASLYNESSLGIISGLSTHPIDDRTAYALFSFAHGPKIIRTTDLGKTWEDISGFGSGQMSSNGFPDVAVFSLLVMPYNTDMLWAGTEIGIFESTDNGASWHFADNGFPAVCAYDMKIVNDQVVVATHGRGVWSVSIPELSGYNPPQAVLSPRFAKLGGGGNGVFTSIIKLPSAYDSTFVLDRGTKIYKLSANPEKQDTPLTFIVNPVSAAAASISLVSYKQGAAYYSSEYGLKIYPLLSPRTAYFNDFNNTSDESDFILNGLVIQKAAGFNDPAINSPHNYPNQSNLTAMLKVPVIVANSGAIVSYDEIALIEPGEDGSLFGSPDFYDYVIVEGSSDYGATWKPLSDGYDARFDPAWLEAFKNKISGTPAMYRRHDIDLLNTFHAGDQVLIRFRLYADPNTIGWGWAIDNLSIQENATDVASRRDVPSSFVLEQNFPNPFNPGTKIRFQIPKEISVTLRIFDAIGREVNTLVDRKMAPGVYEAEWNAGSLPSGIYFYRLEAGEFVQTRKLLLLK